MCRKRRFSGTNIRLPSARAQKGPSSSHWQLHDSFRSEVMRQPLRMPPETSRGGIDGFMDSKKGKAHRAHFSVERPARPRPTLFGTNVGVSKNFDAKTQKQKKSEIESCFSFSSRMACSISALRCSLARRLAARRHARLNRWSRAYCRPLHAGLMFGALSVIPAMCGRVAILVSATYAICDQVKIKSICVGCRSNAYTWAWTLPN